jgi:Spy/CpxP family protein refolding chaperone
MLALVLVFSGGTLGQDKKDGDKAKGQLPQGWGKLGLSSEQRQKVYAIQTDYRAKRSDLEKKLAEMRKQERTEMEAVLTDDQKAKLRELLLQKAPGEKKEEKKSSGDKSK